MAFLVDQFCPNVHDAAITAAAYDPWSGVLATADGNGLVAVTREGEATPGLLFQPGVGVTGALGLVRGGKFIAVGDDDGTIGVYQTSDGAALFQEIREGARGRVRAMRGVAISPEGGRVATISVDGLLRIWDVEKGDRQVAWQGFSGKGLEFDPRGQRILCLDEQGQPRLVDLISNQSLPMDRLKMSADRVTFSLDGTLVVATGQGGISLLRVLDGQIVASFASRGGSGIMNVVQSPDGKRIGAVSQRSVHLFSLPDLQPVESVKHGAPDPSGAAVWLPDGVKVAGSDGLLHGGGTGSAGPVTTIGGFGDYRVAVHGERVAIWKNDQRVRQFKVGTTVREVHIDRDGATLLVLPEDGPMVVFDARTGGKVFDGGSQTKGSTVVGVGGSMVAAMLPRGGLRWWDIAAGRAFELAWPTTMSLSHGGTWLGVVTPRGQLKILNPADGSEAIPDPILPGNVSARQLSFINRLPHLLVLDSDNILLHYDLGVSVTEQRPVSPRDVIQFQGEPARIWGITGGKYAAVKLLEGDSAAVLFVDIAGQAVVGEVAGLDPRVWVDAENGLILEPARGSAILERNMDGSERRVLRSLPDEEWVCFGPRGLHDTSPGFAAALGGD